MIRLYPIIRCDGCGSEIIYRKTRRELTQDEIDSRWQTVKNRHYCNDQCKTRHFKGNGYE